MCYQWTYSPGSSARLLRAPGAQRGKEHFLLGPTLPPLEPLFEFKCILHEGFENETA